MNYYMNKELLINKGGWLKMFVPLTKPELQRICTELHQGSMLWFQVDKVEHVYCTDMGSMKTHSHFKNEQHTL